MRTDGPIRVVIADSHQLFRTGLRLILDSEAGIALGGEAADGLETIEVVSTIQPDVLLLDISLPGTNGIGVLRTLKEKSPATKPLLLVTTRDEGLIFTALRAGAKGYLSKDTTVSHLTKAIQAVHEDELWVERKLVAQFVEAETTAEVQEENRQDGTQQALTTREGEILRLLTSGGTNKEIAQALFISEKTVKCHLNNIFRKLNFTRRLDAVLYAIHCGLT
jgi:two-component system NarL family response regulator